MDSNYFKTDTDSTAIGKGHPLTLISGPCVIEDFETTFKIALELKKITEELNVPFVFKASYDKANRTSIDSYRGPGIEKGLEILERLKNEIGIRILSDVHRVSEVEKAARVLDIIQIPAFLCRQTDLLTEAAGTGKAVNIKKGQFLAPWDIKNAAEKLTASGSRQVIITERGTMFGYNNLVVDFRGVKVIQDMGLPVIFDVTHSIQLPGGAGKSSGGQREYAPVLARAAVAAGVDGLFMEVHTDPDKALCDGPNSLGLDSLPDLLTMLLDIEKALSPYDLNPEKT
ncbi:MAG: 3-deoxy-8-phosphooctulonate synthase [Deltaproteobacteria bacterium]|nr:3-deoxy-8-phosphooctulonate synthase [Deltaproteobacteria bacterium]